MRLFIYELISAGGLGDDPPPSLCREGWAMLSSVVADFQRVPGVKVVTLLNAAAPGTLAGRCVRCRPADEPAAFDAIARQADYALIIAPETGDLLASRSQRAQDAGARLLGCEPDAVRRVSDKLNLAAALQPRRVPALRTWLLQDAPAELPFPRVLKPRVGAGAQATWLVTGLDQWDQAVGAARAELPDSDFVVQPYHAGTPASMAMLCGPDGAIATPGAYQRLRVENRLMYDGGSAPLARPLGVRAERLAGAALAAAPPLRGYVGIDVILGADDAGADDVVVEINPRLTTSYVGLRRLTGDNLAAGWLRLLGLHGTAIKKQPHIDWDDAGLQTLVTW